MIFTFLSITLFTVVITFAKLRTKKWLKFLILILFIIILIPIMIYSLKSKPYTVKGSITDINEIFLFLSMCVGMIANRAFEAIKDGKIVINSLELVKPLFVAPIIFLLTWGILERMQEVNFITYCFAFQNGFFWQVLLDKAQKKLN